ncbi:hypothetical protein QR685DRAFT_530945 [Neurospora intermedia]|uniref:Uncharacterized protein n=1 Tax=Neurospora intermedia TaxID=5142 RepID=A0ABR3D992_NEUIN
MSELPSNTSTYWLWLCLAMAKAILSRTNDHDVKHNFSLRTRPSHTALQRRKGDPYLGAPISVAAKSQGLKQIKSLRPILDTKIPHHFLYNYLGPLNNSIDFQTYIA